MLNRGYVDLEYSRSIQLKAFPVRAINSFTQRFTDPIQRRRCTFVSRGDECVSTLRIAGNLLLNKFTGLLH